MTYIIFFDYVIYSTSTKGRNLDKYAIKLDP